MYRISAYEAVVSCKRDVDNNKVVNVLQVGTDAVLGKVECTLTNDYVARGTTHDLVGDMAR